MKKVLILLLIIVTVGIFSFQIYRKHILYKNTILKKEIINAVIFAYSLENSLFSDIIKISSRNDVYEHYRQGFSEEIANNLTDYSWSTRTNELIATEKATDIPKQVQVLKIKRDTAVVYYLIPEGIKTLWNVDEKYAIDYLKKENGRWIIVKSEWRNNLPE